MEFNEKLQELRKQKGMTQEELASALYVSRTAISKWESGRGYPNLESLKGISRLFSISIDELLSGDQLLTIAEEDSKEKENHLNDLFFGFLDVSALLLLFLPLFAQRFEDAVEAVSLMNLTEISMYLKVIYFFILSLLMLHGVLTLAMQNCNKPLWLSIKRNISILINTIGVFVLIISLQSYAAVFLFVFLIIEILILIKKR